MYICPRLMLIWDCLGSLESLIGLDSLGGFGLFRMVWVESALLGSLGSSPHLPSTLPPAEAYALGHDPEYWDPALPRFSHRHGRTTNLRLAYGS